MKTRYLQRKKDKAVFLRTDLVDADDKVILVRLTGKPSQHGKSVLYNPKKFEAYEGTVGVQAD